MKLILANITVCNLEQYEVMAKQSAKRDKSWKYPEVAEDHNYVGMKMKIQLHTTQGAIVINVFNCPVQPLDPDRVR